MTNIDLTPLYRTMVGFDRTAGMIDRAQRLEGGQGYPPYNIERLGENEFRIELAVAGFSEADLDIETDAGQLTITGRKAEGETVEGREFLHRGIAERSFVRRFQLADHVIVTAASLHNGMLRIALERQLPEEKKPRKIAIGSDPASGAGAASRPKVIEGKKGEAA